MPKEMIILKKLQKYSITNKKPKKIVFTLENTSKTLQTDIIFNL